MMVSLNPQLRRYRYKPGSGVYLGEVPLDIVVQEAALLALQVLVQVAGVGPINLQLSCQRELRTLLGGEALDLLVGARLLSAELVAGSTQHNQALLVVPTR